jgi:hypothetical protein
MAHKLWDSRSMGKLAGSLVIGLGGITLVTACAASSEPHRSEPATLTIAGVGTLESATTISGPDGHANGLQDTDGVECWGMGAHSQLRRDLTVTVTDETGEVVGLGKLGPGAFGKGNAWWECNYPFLVSEVPASAKFYGVQFGDSPIIRLTNEEAQHDWIVDFNGWQLKEKIT